MNKVIMVDFDKCVGCRTCEMVCSIGHEKEINPFRARIRVVKWEDQGHSIPMNCRQCETAPCEAVCPVKALSRDEMLFRVVNDYDKCIGCRACIIACPFGQMSFDIVNKKVKKCDLCDGDPLCVEFCAYGALRYVDATDLNTEKETEAAQRFLGVNQAVEIAIASQFQYIKFDNAKP